MVLDCYSQMKNNRIMANPMAGYFLTTEILIMSLMVNDPIAMLRDGEAASDVPNDAAGRGKTRNLLPLPSIVLDPTVRAALLEDLGRAGDLTTNAIVADDRPAQMELVARESGVIAGLDIARIAFTLIDSRIRFEPLVNDGDTVGPGLRLALVHGPARGLLTAERTALNFLGHLSGVATATASIARAIAPWGARVTCTRKTLPGLRAMQKYAVRAGGGSNHRFGLDDAVLIKDNHIALAGGISTAVARARKNVGHLVKIELEVDTLEQLDEALAIGVDVVLLDNMSPHVLKEAVRRAKGRAMTEASGKITPESAEAVAATGVDLIAVGWLTHSARVLDIGLDVVVT